MLTFLTPAQAEDRAALLRQHRGGTLHLTASAAAGTIDPQVNYESQFNQVFAFTQDELVTFRKAEGVAATDLVADVAETVPTPTDGGTSYTFHIRHGIRFSTGRELTPDDVVASLQRMFKVVGPNVGSWYSVIVGADACLAVPATCTLAGGVSADAAAWTVTIRLKHPSGEFLDQLSMPFAAILPAGTPPHDLGTVPPAATGPYMITAYEPTRRMRIVRNPYFREWSADAQPDGFVDAIDYRYGLQDEAEVTAIENGQQDWMYDEKPLDRLQEIGSRYTSLAHLHPMLAYYYVSMNVHERPFDDVRVRRAVAMAINRRAAVNLFGGPALATPLCQLLPAGMPGYEPTCPFSLPPGDRWVAPDLEQARALVRESGTAGMHVTFISSDKQVERTIGVYMQSVLQDLGYDSAVHAVSFNIRDPYMENSGNHYQIGLTDWYQDYPSPSDFLQVMFSCRTIHPSSDASINMSQFCDPALEARMDQATTLAATDQAGAAALWTGIDRDMTEQAPGTTLFQVNYLDLVSRRTGHFRFSTLYHVLLSQLWVQ